MCYYVKTLVLQNILTNYKETGCRAHDDGNGTRNMKNNPSQDHKLAQAKKSHGPDNKQIRRMQKASKHQDLIGWTNFMIGRMAHEWEVAQQCYYDWLGRRKTGRRWLVAITVKLLNLSWDMWDHRNKILHSSNHPWKLIKVRQADIQIEEDYKCGYRNLRQKDYKCLKPPLHITKNLPIEIKLQWLESLCLARIRFDRDTLVQYQSFCPKCLAIAKWIWNGNINETVSDEDL
jgi:hypothetical protein